LAYSTVSQLGFMVAAVGIGAYAAAIFHMMTHAFFKALLFLGSGSVIHGMEHGHHHLHDHGHGAGGHGHDDKAHAAAHDSHGHDSHGHDSHGHDEKHDDHAHDDHFDPQDMRTMGGLSRRMPITYITYVIGAAALAGIWPLSGFWSKDEILADAWRAAIFDGKLSGYIALGLLLAAAFMTAFYMTRQVWLVFHGEGRHDAVKHVPESVWQMTVPLIILGVFSVFIGFVNLPSDPGVSSLGLEAVFGLHALTDWLEYSVLHAHVGAFEWLIALVATGVGLAAIFLGIRIYGGANPLNEKNEDPLYVNRGFRPLFVFSNARMYWDEAYDRLFIRPFQAIARLLARVDWDFWHDYVHDSVITKGFNGVAKILSQPVDNGLIDGTVRGVGRLVKGISGVLRQAQTGYVRVYAVALLVGVVAVVVLMLLPVLQG
jgi:NADH-quinone oxidoreductase subunit L